MPTDRIAAWLADALTPQRLHAIRRERGLTRETIDGHVGWDRVHEAWVLLARDSTGEVVNVTRRPPRGAWCYKPGGTLTRKPHRLRGRGAPNGGLPLWPRVPDGDEWLLVAGEWDALAGLQAGLPAVTGLLGCQWHSAWDHHAVGKRIAVCYDIGEESAARTTVERLRWAGAREAWNVDLGLPEPGDDIERALRPRRYGGYGWTPARLMAMPAVQRLNRRAA